MLPTNFRYPIYFKSENWKQQYNNAKLGPYNQWIFSDYPDPNDKGYQQTNNSEFVQDNVYLNEFGRYVVRRETEYELQNLVITPDQTRPGLIITPRRLARDPSSAIHNYYYGWRHDPADTRVLQSTMRYHSKRLNRRRAKRD